jgi:hypothetical protein
VVTELRIIEVKKGANTFVCSMRCFLQWSRSENEEFLEGTYVATNITDSSYCGKGNVFLRRVFNSDFYKEPFIVKKEKAVQRKRQLALAESKPATKPRAVTKPAPAATKQPEAKKPPVKTAPAKPPVKKPAQTEKNMESKPLAGVEKIELDKPSDIRAKKANPVIVPPVLKNRSNEVVKTITINVPSITVSLYDNGTIDNDTVSVYLNKKLVVSKQKLTTAPITVQLAMDENHDYHELTMVAENLGEIPHNNSLMVVKAGDKQFEVRITSTEQKNAVVIFKYEKPKDTAQ